MKNDFLEGFSYGFLIGFKNGSSSGGGSGDDSNQGQIWNWCIAKGFTKEATAGIIGNLMQESGCNPTAEEGPYPDYGYGLFQWTGDRRVALVEYANEHGENVADLNFQMDYFWYEANGPEAWRLESIGGIQGYMQYTDINKATTDFCDLYEAPGTPMLENRLAYAHEYYNKFA